MDSDYVYCFSRREKEIERWEAMKSRALYALDIPTELLGREIVIYAFAPDTESTFIVYDSIDTTIQNVHFNGRSIILTLPPGLKISSVKKNIRNINKPWLAIIEQHYVERNNRMLMSVIQEFGSLILDGFDRDTAGTDEWKKEMGNRLMIMEELEEWEEQGIDDERLEEIKNSEGSWFIEAISSYSEDKIKSDIDEFPVHVCFP